MIVRNQKIRSSFIYKMKLWFYRVTFRDIEKILQIIIKFWIEFIMCCIGLGLLLILPAFFH